MAIINTSKNTHKPAPKPVAKPAPKKTTAYIPDKPKPAPKPVYKTVPLPKPTPKPPAPKGKMADIYKDQHKPAPKPVYKPTPSKPAPKGKMADIYKDHHKPVAKTTTAPKKPTTTTKAPPKVTTPVKKTTVAPKTSTAPKTTTKAPPKTTAPHNHSHEPAPKTTTAPPKVVAPPPLPKADKYGTVGPTNNGAANWNSNQSIPNYGAMTPEMIRDIQDGYQNPASYDAANDQVYQSMLLLANKQAAAAGLASMEQMNDRGILNSTMTTDRDQQIRQGASDAVIGAIPQLAGNWQSQQNQNQAGYLNLLQTVMGGAEHQQEFAEGNRRYDKNFQLDEADVTGTYNSAEAIAKGQVQPGFGIQTLKKQGQLADQKLANDKLAFEKDAFGRELNFKEKSFDREMNFQEQDSMIKNDLASRGLDLDEIKIGIDRFTAESDAEYKLRQEQSGLSEYEASTNTNRAIGTILGVDSLAEGFAFIESQTNAWASSGVDFKSVINALESKFPGAKEVLDNGGYGSTP